MKLKENCYCEHDKTLQCSLLHYHGTISKQGQFHFPKHIASKSCVFFLFLYVMIISLGPFFSQWTWWKMHFFCLSVLLIFLFCKSWGLEIYNFKNSLICIFWQLPFIQFLVILKWNKHERFKPIISSGAKRYTLWEMKRAMLLEKKTRVSVFYWCQLE